MLSVVSVDLIRLFFLFCFTENNDLPACLNGVDASRPLENFRKLREFRKEKLKKIFLRLHMGLSRNRRGATNKVKKKKNRGKREQLPPMNINEHFKADTPL